MKRLTTKEVESVLEPIFSITVEALQLKIPVDSRNVTYQDLLKSFKRDAARRVFRIIDNLIDARKIKDKMAERLGNETNANEVDAAIKVFIDNGLVLRIETPEMQLQLLPSYKLMITPLGLCFLYCHRTGLLSQATSLEESVFCAKQLLGSAYNDYIKDEVRNSLLERETNLDKKEIAISLLLLLSQAVTDKRALKIQGTERGEALAELTKTLNKIGEKIFSESGLFTNIEDTANAVRRSTGSGGLENKMQGHYVKKSLGDDDILYFKSSSAQDMVSIADRICKSIREGEKGDDAKYGENVIKLIDKHVKDRNFLIPPWIRRKLFSQEAETRYLQELMGVFRRELG